MKLTKYQHACVVVEEQGQKLVIDPGEFTKEFGDLSTIVAVVVTHEHGDHFDRNHLKAIIAANPRVTIFTTADVAEQWQDSHVTAVRAGQTQNAGPFNLEFFGDLHAEIHHSTPRPQNIGVLVNNQVYYPGDSFTQPREQVPVLAIPAGAPWLKVGEGIDFMQDVMPARCFPTHDALLSERGRASVDKWYGQTAEKIGASYLPLKPGDSIEI
jgi:L-ascorbate metabolism protein UlaG (beta-lactamase superfamily)